MSLHIIIMLISISLLILEPFRPVRAVKCYEIASIRPARSISEYYAVTSRITITITISAISMTTAIPKIKVLIRGYP